MVAYHRPTSLAVALDLKAKQPLTVIAGGTDLYPARTNRMAWGDMRKTDMLDISGIADLRGIEATDDGWKIGALATWTDLIRAPLPESFDGLKAAAREVGGVQIQNRGTIAGNICNASPAADGVPALLSLDAEIEIASQTVTRRMPLAQFIDGYRHTVLSPQEIVTAIHVPNTRGYGRFLKLGARRYLVISITMVAGSLDLDPDGRIKSARLAIGACSAIAQRLSALEAEVIGQTPADAARLVETRHFSALAPIDDVRATAPYRAHAAMNLTRDLISGFTTFQERAA